MKSEMQRHLDALDNEYAALKLVAIDVILNFENRHGTPVLAETFFVKIRKISIRFLVKIKYVC